MNRSPNETRPLLSVRNVSKTFRSKGGKTVYAVSDVSFDIVRGRTLGVIGESGSGKTTVGRMLLRLIEPNGGAIIFDGFNLTNVPQNRLRAFRKRMQIIFQDPFGSLNPRLRVSGILGESLDLADVAVAGRPKIIADLLETVGLRPEHAQRFPHELSGGQRQRVAIARAVAVRPDFIVADEAVSALDVSVQAQILNLLLELQSTLDLTILFIGHDLGVVEYFCDDIAVMYLGRIVERGPREKVYGSPKHPYTRALIAAAPVLDPLLRSSKAALPGDIPSPLNPPSGCAFRTRCSHAVGRCADVFPPEEEISPGHFVSCIRHEEISDPDLMPEHPTS